jgi:1-acylglycerone phosphate reductase
MSSSKKTVLITGTSSGIGHALAREFNAKGYHVLATARRTDSIQDLKALGITPLAVDVDSPGSIAALKKEVEALTGGRLDMLINNAGPSIPSISATIDGVQDADAPCPPLISPLTRWSLAFAPTSSGFVSGTTSRGELTCPGHAHVPDLRSAADRSQGHHCPDWQHRGRHAVCLRKRVQRIQGRPVRLPLSSVTRLIPTRHAYSNTLRVEMAPFDVKVVTVMTGGVMSGLTRTEVHLPAGSIYLPINADFERRSGYSQEVGMPTDQYAQSVVSQLLPRRPKRLIWQGTGSTLIWIASTFLPYWVMVSSPRNMRAMLNLIGLLLFLAIQLGGIEKLESCKEE